MKLRPDTRAVTALQQAQLHEYLLIPVILGVVAFYRRCRGRAAGVVAAS